MKPNRANTLVIWSAVAASVVLAAAGWALRGRLLEQYYLWRLGSEHPDERRVAVRNLREMGSVKALPRLSAMILPVGESDNEVRYAAADAMGKIAPRAEAIPYLLSMLKNRDVPEFRRFAAWSLGEIGRSAKLAIPELEEALRDKEEPVRTAACRALRKIEDSVP
jgi:HEAT repeat protein